MEYPSWEIPIQEAALEADLSKAAQKVHDAEAAIFARTQQLAASNDGHHEMAAIQRGLQELLRIKTHKLNWPSIDGNR